MVLLMQESTHAPSAGMLRVRKLSSGNSISKSPKLLINTQPVGGGTRCEGDDVFFNVSVAGFKPDI